MILRKPYAFLMKHFRKINFVLLILVGFVLWRDLALYNFVRNYVATGIYNVRLDAITNYFNVYLLGALLFVSFVSIVLGFLLKRKDKPYISYFLILIVSIVNIALLLFVFYYFTITINSTSFDLSSALVVRDLSFMVSLPYYPVIFLLVIRAIGLDLKSFGFGTDKDFDDVGEEDREEVEVEVSFDKDRYIRKFRKAYRHFKYFFLENKIKISVIFAFVILLAGFNLYRYVFVENKLYHPGDTFTVNGLSITTHESYLTNRDYTGNIINNDRYFFILDATITNKTSREVAFNANNFYLYVDRNYYIPTNRYNLSFADMGTLFNKGDKIPAAESKEWLFVFEISKPTNQSAFLLTYQTLSLEHNPKRVSLSTRDISNFIEKGNVSLKETLTVPINLEQEWTFSLYDLEIVDKIKYRYEVCNPSTCPVFEKEMSSKLGNTILHLKMNYKEGMKTQFLNFVKKYGKIRYKVGDTYKEETIRYPVDNYQGKHLYLVVSDDIKNATSIELCFTVRSYQYIYRIKGE